MTPEQNDLLCRVEGDAPMGKLMRQHWLPACMSEEVAEPDSPPRRVRLLGENMVVFRDSEGRVGVLDELCPHRRASLVFGRNEECGLRCLYHGWKFDVNGKVLDMSSEPEDSHMRGKVNARAYPVVEEAGFIWVWMGDPDNVGEFNAPNWSSASEGNISIMKIHGACNWAQILEGAIDSSHSSSLHSSNMPTAEDVSGSTATETAWLRPSADKSPRIEVEKTSFGFRYAAIRKPIKDADKQDYVRTTLFIAPFTAVIPSNDQYHLSQLLIPIDDENTYFYWIAWSEDPEKGIGQDAWRKFCGAEVGKDVEPVTYKKVRNYDNNYLQDREAMKDGDFTGIYGIPCQDMAMWESMGKIADRSEDNLGTSDKAIFTFRTQMYRAAQSVQKGGAAIGAGSDALPQSKLISFQGMVPKGEDWKQYNISDEERALREAKAHSKAKREPAE
ncbi:Rieske 2Fe-2S domain-containing protein [Erythrobacter westpacificensis]|uniref:Rieske 2Fe-2S domain-containing protein n=1 Tax=Erythrobacter westpacificensis TaxID=1055231 RepID=A0ABP9K3S4_9SPHN